MHEGILLCRMPFFNGRDGKTKKTEAEDGFPQRRRGTERTAMNTGEAKLVKL
jgi:hypothetical protein